ncbi:hypothetical protein [Mucilaginibacter gracilis]|uniref:hypothetical protein n=1 Tax=Mucilaginibacter gracilis TaxID=423350 RepID=UPI0011C457EA|nr:hypothetical protein [Mucilaginibacter gracilis]
MNKKILNSLRNSIPWILAGLGVIFIIMGEILNLTQSTKPILDYSKEKFNGALIEIGKAVLISGVASITLNSLRYMGIYNEELIKLLFDTKFLRNRHDLPSYWQKVTKELLSDKFPKINDLILNDVQEIYLPTSSFKYYENFWQHTNIKMTDKSTEMIDIVQTTKFTVVAVDKDKTDHQLFTNRCCHGGKHANATYSVTSLFINKKPITPEIENNYEGNFLDSKFSVTLSGSDTYEIEMVCRKTYSLKNDCIMGYRHQNITHNSTVQFQLDGVKVEFNPLGTLKDFETKTQNDSLIVKEYVGLLYKNQGYTAYLKKK